MRRDQAKVVIRRGEPIPWPSSAGSGIAARAGRLGPPPCCPITLNCETPLQERAMDNEIQPISDGDGLAVIGNPTDVERFPASEGLSSKDLGLRWLKSVVGTGAIVAQAGSEVAANGGRWVKPIPESAQLVKTYGLRESATQGRRRQQSRSQPYVSSNADCPTSSTQLCEQTFHQGPTRRSLTEELETDPRRGFSVGRPQGCVNCWIAQKF